MVKWCADVPEESQKIDRDTHIEPALNSLDPMTTLSKAKAVVAALP